MWPMRWVPSTVRAFSRAARQASVPVCGQPLPQTHPHLFPADFRIGIDPAAGGRVAEEHLTPGIPAAEYEQRRKALMDGLPEKSAVVLMGGRTKYMSRNIFYKFRQESNFWVCAAQLTTVPHWYAGARCRACAGKKPQSSRIQNDPLWCVQAPC